MPGWAFSFVFDCRLKRFCRVITIQTMIGLARRLGLLSGAGDPAGRQYSPDEVHRFLAGAGVEEPEPLRRAIAWLPVALRNDQSLANRFRHFPNCRESLPKIISLYQKGYTPDQIVDQMEFLATEYAISETIRITADIVADRVNRPNP